MNEARPWQQLFEKIIGSWVSRAIYAAAKLRIAASVICFRILYNDSI